MLSCCCFCLGKFQSPRTEHLFSTPLLSSLPSESSCLLPCILLFLLLHTASSSSLFSHHRGRINDFKTRNKVLAAKLLRQSYRYHKIRKFFFSKFYRGHFFKYNVGLKTLLLQGLSEPFFMAICFINSEKWLVKMIFLIISIDNCSL